MNYIALRNWDHYQHYKDRNPPWIKLYNSLLDEYDFAILPDAAKWHVVASTLLASRTNNKIPADPRWIAAKIGATDPVSIDLLLASGMFVQLQQDETASAVVAQDASNVLALARSRETEKRQRREEQIIPESDPRFIDFWASVPKRIDKLESRRELTKVLKATPIETVIAGAKRWTSSSKGTEAKFIPSPAKWLRNHKWEDEVPKETPQQTLKNFGWPVN